MKIIVHPGKAKIHKKNERYPIVFNSSKIVSTSINSQSDSVITLALTFNHQPQPLLDVISLSVIIIPTTEH